MGLNLHTVKPRLSETHVDRDNDGRADAPIQTRRSALWISTIAAPMDMPSVRNAGSIACQFHHRRVAPADDRSVHIAHTTWMMHGMIARRQHRGHGGNI